VPNAKPRIDRRDSHTGDSSILAPKRTAAFGGRRFDLDRLESAFARLHIMIYVWYSRE